MNERIHAFVEDTKCPERIARHRHQRRIRCWSLTFFSCAHETKTFSLFARIISFLPPRTLIRQAVKAVGEQQQLSGKNPGLCYLQQLMHTSSTRETVSVSLSAQTRYQVILTNNSVTNEIRCKLKRLQRDQSRTCTHSNRLSLRLSGKRVSYSTSGHGRSSESRGASQHACKSYNSNRFHGD
jgi:hypothetical protein